MRWRNRFAVAVALLVGSGALWGIGLERGWWRMNHPDLARFPAWGVDVSHHQGVIDWAAVARAPHISFAYVKATEGTDWRDPSFHTNWEGARRAGLRTGAYHFFSFCTLGLAQAANFLSTVPGDLDALPPALDVEFGGNCKAQMPVPELKRQLRIWLTQVADRTRRKPIIYATSEAYDTLLAGDFPGEQIWIRDVWHEPSRSVGWAFWQFANRERIKGIAGFVDLDAFHGSQDQLVRVANRP